MANDLDGTNERGPPELLKCDLRLRRRSELRELNQLRSLAELRRRFGLGIGDLAFAARLRREPELRAAIDGWLADVEDASWVEWEQRKHERLLAA